MKAMLVAVWVILGNMSADFSHIASFISPFFWNQAVVNLNEKQCESCFPAVGKFLVFYADNRLGDNPVVFEKVFNRAQFNFQIPHKWFVWENRDSSPSGVFIKQLNFIFEVHHAGLNTYGSSNHTHQSSGRLANVFGLKSKLEYCLPILDANRPVVRKIDIHPSSLIFAQQDIGLQSGSSGALSFSESLPSGLQSPVNKKHTNRSQDSHRKRYSEHPKSPKGHLFLSLQILIGGLFGVIGFKLIGNAISEIQTRHPLAEAIYFVTGIVAIMFGILLISGINLMYFGVLFDQ